jgi:hypothetical protein
MALIRSIMEYGAIIWDPYNKNDINKLENLQRRGGSTTTARVLFLTCEFTMFVVSQSWNVLALMCRLGFWWLIYS